MHPAPPRGPRLTRFPACGPLEPYLPEPAKPPAKYLQDLGPGPALNGGHFYESPEEGNARRGALSLFTPRARRGLPASISRSLISEVFYLSRPSARLSLKPDRSWSALGES